MANHPKSHQGSRIENIVKLKESVGQKRKVQELMKEKHLTQKVSRKNKQAQKLMKTNC